MSTQYFAINEAIQSVEVFHASHFLFRFYRKNTYIKLYLSNFHQCCESFGINIFSSNNTGDQAALPTAVLARDSDGIEDIRSFLLPLEGQMVQGIAINLEPPSFKDEWSEKQSIDVVFQLASVRKIRFELFNDHNGYYPHDFDVDIQVKPAVARYTGTL